MPINDLETRVIADALFKDLMGLGPLEDLLTDPSIEDILCNGPKEVFVSRGGVLERASTRFTDSAHLLRIVRRILAPLGRRLDESTPMVDASAARRWPTQPPSSSPLHWKVQWCQSASSAKTR